MVTVTLSFIGILIGLPIGLGLALLRWANVPVAARIVTLYVSILRATPLVTLAAAVVLRPSQYRRADRSDLGGDPWPCDEYLGLQLRGLAVGADEFSEGSVRGGAVGRHARRTALSQDRAAADRAREPARPRQRDVAADQGHARAGGGGRRRYHPRRGQDRRRKPTSRCRRFLWRSRSMRRSSSRSFRCSAGSSAARSRPRPPHDPRFRHRLERTRAAVERARQYGDPVDAVGRSRRCCWDSW